MLFILTASGVDIIADWCILATPTTNTMCYWNLTVASMNIAVSLVTLWITTDTCCSLWKRGSGDSQRFFCLAPVKSINIMKHIFTFAFQSLHHLPLAEALTALAPSALAQQQTLVPFFQQNPTDFPLSVVEHQLQSLWTVLPGLLICSCYSY